MPFLALNCRLQVVQVNAKESGLGFSFSALSFSFTDSLFVIGSCSFVDEASPV